MSNDVRTANPPPKPLLIYDGDCGFCRRWVSRWQRATGDAIDYLPFQDEAVSARFPKISRKDFEESIHLISPDGSVCSGAKAVFQSLADGGAERWLFWCYRKIPPFAELTELIYEEIAGHREFLSQVDRFFLGHDSVPHSYAVVRYFFLRSLALVYLTAFVSLAVQIQGLVGSHGIVPADGYMRAIKQLASDRNIGVGRIHLLPTLDWWTTSDSSLYWQCGIGIVLSLLLLVGIAPAPALFLLWAIYLSLSGIAGPFLSFQWDTLLLETGFLAIFFAPLQWVERPSRQPEPSHIVLWLLRWLLFRLMFESGCVKLMSGDPTWWHLTALRVHFETQPLPTWIGWYAHQLPGAVLSVWTFLMFMIELVVPFFIFIGRKPRRIACWIFVFFQVVILLTGNYTFFNWLTIILCIPLLDDRMLRGLVPGRWRGEGTHLRGVRWRWKITVPLAALVALTTVLTLPMPGGVAGEMPRWWVAIYEWVGPFRSFNNYGLFASMTQTRPEIILEGSNDGTTWQEYEFKYKPGDLKRRPEFVAPYQPRLDWQMWFAALGGVEENRWFFGLERQLLVNSPPVIGLLGRNPFPTAPPKYIRAQLYEYHFTDLATRRKTGDWWRRDYLGIYVPQLTLADFEPQNAK